MTILLLILAYLLGSIPSGLIIGKVFYNKDIRKFGSGNLGATNTFRILGKKAGIIVTIIDVLKGTIAILLPFIFEYHGVHQFYLGVLAVIGHIFPIFAQFKGGKAVATSAGVILGYAPILFLIIAIGFFAALWKTKYVSFASMTAVTIAVVYGLSYFIFITHDWYLLVLVIALWGFIFYRHRANIERIHNGTEPKVKWI